MKPTNFKDNNCESKSANCVLWDSDTLEIDGLKICRGESISYPIYLLAKAVENLQEQVSLNGLDLDCLTDLGTPTDFKDLIQMLITKSCQDA